MAREPNDIRETADLICRYQDQALSMFDAVTPGISRKLSLPVWAYDCRCDVVGVGVWRDV